MSVAFTDTIIELSYPSARKIFDNDPRAFLEGRGLSDEEISALIQGKTGSFFRYAKSVESSDLSQQFNRLTKASDLLIEIDPVVEVHVENNDLIAVGSLGQIVIGEDGRRYRVVAE